MMSLEQRKLRRFETLESRRTLDSEAPYVVSIQPPDSSSRVVIEFNEAVENVDKSDFQLFRNSVPANGLVLSGQWLTTTRFELALTALDDASYDLALSALSSDIADLAGNPIRTDASQAWTIDTQSPTFTIDFTPAAQAARVPFRVAAMGDSMTLESTGSYVQFVRQQFASTALEAMTFAGSGWKVETLRQVWDTEVRDAGFDAVIIFAGLPNLTSVTADADEIFIGLKSIYDDAIARGIHVICISPSPWADYRKWTIERQTETNELNALISDYVQQHPDFLHFVDAYHEFAMPDEPTRLAPKYGIGDGVHYSEVGDRHLGEMVTPIVASLIPKRSIHQTAALRFSEPVSNILATQLSVTLSGAPVAFQLTQVSPSEYRVEFDLTEGITTELAIGLNVASTTDLAGNPLLSRSPQTFSIDYQAPLGSLSIDQPVISSTSVAEVAISFNEDITGLSLANFQLLNGRLPVDLGAVQLERIDARRYRLNLSAVVGLDGNYELNFVPSNETTDLAGNVFLRGYSRYWVTLPQAPQVNGSVLTLTATRGSDTLELVVGNGTAEWAIGGVPAALSLTGIDQIRVLTGAGIDYISMRVLPGAQPIAVTAQSPDGLDSAFLYDSVGNDTWLADPLQSTLTAPTFQLNVLGFTMVSAFSRSGVDAATLSDSSGNDLMDSRGWVSTLKGTNFNNTAFGFAQVTAQAIRGGTDVTDFFDTDGDDVAMVTPTQASMTAGGYTYTVKNFGRVNIRATLGFDRATFRGTSEAESYVGQTSSSFWTGNGFSRYAYSFDEVEVIGGGGADRATLYDSPASDRLEANTRTATLIMPGVRLTTVDIPRTNVYARNGLDTATFIGRSVSETFVTQPTVSSLTAGGFSVYAFAFDHVSAVGNGGNDIATLYGSAGDDLYVSSPTSARLSGPGYSVEANGFRKFNAYARSGNDVAIMTSGAASEVLAGQSTSTSITGPENTNFAYGFDRVEATGDANDVANLYDTGGNDTFESNGAAARLYGTNFDNRVSGFGRVNAFARTGLDTAILNGTAAAETFTGRSTASSLIGNGFAMYAYAFDRLTARGGGGADVATLNDSAGNDQFTGTPTSAVMLGPAYQIAVEGFPRVNAYASTGQDTAQLQGSTSNDVAISRPDYVSIKNSRYSLLAKGFDSVTTDGFGGNDTATFYDSAGNDVVTTGYRMGSMSGLGYFNSLTGFNKLTFLATSGHDTAVLNDTPGDDTFTGEAAGAQLSTAGLSISLNSFDTISLAASTAGFDRVITNSLNYQLLVGLGWN